MVADLLDQLAVHVAHLVDVRRVDDDFAAVGDRRLRLVGALGGRPEVVVHRRHDRQHAIERLVDPDDVAPRRERGRLPPGLVDVAAEQARDAVVRDDEREQRERACRAATPPD